MTDKNFTIYKSSAGSGKTFTLVKEYLALALSDAANPPQAYKHILAVTFTNKAAAEMKERIIKALKELSDDDYSLLFNGTKTLLVALKAHKKLNVSSGNQASDTDAIIRSRAKNVLTSILHNYSDFAIGTIDSFVHKVVRTFAFDLKIPMSFEIEMDDEKLLSQTIDLLLARIGNDDRLTKALVEFAETKASDEKSWHIENDLKYFAKNLLDDEGFVHIEKLKHLSVDDFFKIKDILFSEIKKFEAAIKTEAEKACSAIVSCGLSAKDFYYGDKGIAGYFQKLKDGHIDYIVPNTYVQTTVGEDKWTGSKVTARSKSDIDAIKSGLLDSFNNIQILKDAGYSNYVLFNLINRNIYSLAVLNEIEKLLQEYKSQNNILHISEFNKLISRIVMNEPIPFIYERLGERYSNYLIDEFQDTSVLQFQNLLPLIDNSLASGYFTMLVGDGKQAIYRWRGGEVEQFSMLPKVFSHNDNPLVIERENALIRNHNPQVLDKNYRSKKEVIEFNNSIFTSMAGSLNERYRGIYENLVQGFNPENTGGLVRIEFIDGDTAGFRERNMIRTQEIILKQLAQGYMLQDIAILVRKNTDGSEMANFLTQKGIDVISPDSLLLSNSPEVNFLHALLKYLVNENDDITQAEITEYLVAARYFSGAGIDQVLARKEKEGLLSVFKAAGINFNYVRFSKMALYELSEELISTFKLNEKPNAYLQFFLDEVLNYTLKKNNNLGDFIEYWGEKKFKASLIVPEGMNAVNIMTIHRSKGLEFPVVIMPFANSRVETGKKNLWIDLEIEGLGQLPSALVPTSKDLTETPYAELYEQERSKSFLDTLNVLYVAFTRAEERMYVLSGMPGKIPSNMNNVSDMLAYYYQSTGEWQDGKNIYSYGEEHPRKQHKKEAIGTDLKLEIINSNNWRDSIKMRAAAPSIWNTQAAEVKKDYGVMVHTALSKIKSSEDVGLVLNHMCSQGLITREEEAQLNTSLTRILKLPQLSPHFEKGLTIKNEAEIITKDGELLRPDRVILNKKNAVIIDYKTGSEKPKHKEQVDQYAGLLVQMGYTVTDKLLVYIEEEKVVKC